MGADINVHDQWACESMGAIADRTQEHLGQSDKAIAAYRRLLRAAIDAVEKGDAPPIVFDTASAKMMSGPAAIDGIGVEQDRKSTRLNSSHVSISYAVFCLKKK